MATAHSQPSSGAASPARQPSDKIVKVLPQARKVWFICLRYDALKPPQGYLRYANPRSVPILVLAGQSNANNSDIMTAAFDRAQAMGGLLVLQVVNGSPLSPPA